MNSLGDRIKKYERCYDNMLTPNSCVFIRVDGRAFHTFSKHEFFKVEDSPFSRRMMNAMLYAAECTAEDMQGFKLAYTQSDECTFMLTDFDTQQTEGWFGYRLNKLVSITAAMYTAWFNNFLPNYMPLAFFDARAFVVPLEDAPNVFVWRQKDWERNSIQMLAQHHFSHKQLHKKNTSDMHEMLHEIDVNWAELHDDEKNGTFLLPRSGYRSEVLSYDQILEIITPKVQDEATDSDS